MQLASQRVRLGFTAFFQWFSGKNENGANLIEFAATNGCSLLRLAQLGARRPAFRHAYRLDTE